MRRAVEKNVVSFREVLVTYVKGNLLKENSTLSRKILELSDGATSGIGIRNNMYPIYKYTKTLFEF